MARITISNFDDRPTDKLQHRPELNGRSIEEEAGDLLAKSLQSPRTGFDIIRSFREAFAEVQPVDLEIFSREAIRLQPDFSE